MDLWEDIKKFFQESENNVYLRELNYNEKATYKNIGVVEESVLGQTLKNISIITINNYLRILGGDCIAPFNKIIKEFYSGNKLVVANDIWGGLYAIGNGDFAGDIRNIWYFAPDSLEWEDLEINYPQFMVWACSKNIKKFYEKFVWNDIDLVIHKLKENQAILVYPFLWSLECNIETADKTIVPIEELVALNASYWKKFSINE